MLDIEGMVVIAAADEHEVAEEAERRTVFEGVGDHVGDKDPVGARVLQHVLVELPE
jgi:hypothetical protein